MAATFRPVNSPMAVVVTHEDVMASSPTTPRANTAPQAPPTRPVDDASTPTRASFNGTPMNSQKPLPSNSFPQAVQVPQQSAKPKSPQRENSQHSAKSVKSGGDVDMDDSDGEAGIADDGAGSDEESVGADGSRSGKKKKSQRFYCVDYPPCNLSFTRSEHLARHIRKHTGERPFQCHCSRRFSRLDNLRQHAQTVHVNENIPLDSLAATGSRFQRQMRTERVRQAGHRARASTGGSAGGPVRGHSKSLSTSSITSMGSIASTYSTPADARRPAPLVMADPRYRGPPEAAYATYRPPSPSDFGTPTSATFSAAGQGSPRWGSGMASPASSHSRSHSMYAATGTRTPGRRLSVPSGANPFQSPSGLNVGRPVFAPGSVPASNAGVFYHAPNNQIAASPTPSPSHWPRRESISSMPDDAWRRRTWHPDSRNPQPQGSPSQLSNVANQMVAQPNPPPPIATPSQPQSALRLPGIESFDPLPRRPATPPRRNPSPMMIDSEQHPHRPVLHQSVVEAAPPVVVEERRNLNMYDASLQRGLNRLDINHSTPPRDGAGAWASEVNKAVQAQAEQARVSQPTVRFEEQPPSYQSSKPAVATRALHQHTMSAPSITTSRDSKRHGWYHGPVTVHRETRAPVEKDARGPHVDRIVHPNMHAFSGFPARESIPESHAIPQQQPPPQHHHQQSERPANNESLGRLEALVAVATSEGSTATAY